jgi:hypothetical protein
MPCAGAKSEQSMATPNHPLSTEWTVQAHPGLVGSVPVPALKLAAVDDLIGAPSQLIFDPDTGAFIPPTQPHADAYVWVDPENNVHYPGKGSGARGVVARAGNEVRWSQDVARLIAAGGRPWTDEALWRKTPLPKWIFGQRLRVYVLGVPSWTSADPDGPPSSGAEVERFVLEASAQLIGRRAVIGGSAWEPGSPLGKRADAWATERIEWLRKPGNPWDHLQT